ncbi:MAG: DedA family protein [Candidatus Woesearchaeota archaeon]|jgi:membrane protein DedA with SNARE-associated domain
MILGDFTTTTGILAFLQSAGYLLLLLVIILEGPIITIVAAFAAFMGVFNVYVVFALSVLGNIIGDIIYYYLGRISRRGVIERYLQKSKIKKGTLHKIESSLRNNPGKALTIIKLVPPLPAPGLILAGVVNIRIKTFLFYSFILTFISSLVLVLIGYYTGLAFESFTKYSRYLELSVLLILVLGVITWFSYRGFSRRVYENMDQIK